MAFSDFVEYVIETPIRGKLKQNLDKCYEFYAKDPEKCKFNLTVLQRGSAKSNAILILLPFLLETYRRENEK